MSGQNGSAGYQSADEDLGMALSQTTLDELQVYASKASRMDGKNNPMLMDVLSSYCAGALLRLEEGEAVKSYKHLQRDITKYNKEIRKAQREAETKAQAKAEEEAKAKVKAEAEAQAKAKAEDDAKTKYEYSYIMCRLTRR